MADGVSKQSERVELPRHFCLDYVAENESSCAADNAGGISGRPNHVGIQVHTDVGTTGSLNDGSENTPTTRQVEHTTTDEITTPANKF